jgi:hypothetical protein
MVGAHDIGYPYLSGMILKRKLNEMDFGIIEVLMR